MEAEKPTKKLLLGKRCLMVGYGDGLLAASLRDAGAQVSTIKEDDSLQSYRAAEIDAIFVEQGYGRASWTTGSYLDAVHKGKNLVQRLKIYPFLSLPKSIYQTH